MTSRQRTGPANATGRCVACGQPHALDVSYRCLGCEGEVCALCVAFVGTAREPWCPACQPKEDD